MSKPNDSLEWGYLNNVPGKNSKMDEEYDYSPTEKYKPSKAINRRKTTLITLFVLSAVLILVSGGCTMILVESIQNSITM